MAKKAKARKRKPSASNRASDRDRPMGNFTMDDVAKLQALASLVPEPSRYELKDVEMLVPDSVSGFPVNTVFGFGCAYTVGMGLWGAPEIVIPIGEGDEDVDAVEVITFLLQAFLQQKFARAFARAKDELDADEERAFPATDQSGLFSIGEKVIDCELAEDSRFNGLRYRIEEIPQTIEGLQDITLSVYFYLEHFPQVVVDGLRFVRVSIVDDADKAAMN